MTAGKRTIRLAPAEVTTFFTRLADEFVALPGYLRIDDRPAVSVLNLPDFVAAYSVDGVRFLLRLLRYRIRERLGEDPFIIGLLPDGSRASVATCRALPCDGVTGYGLLPDWHGPPVQRYAELIDKRVAEWYRIQRELTVPFFPVVCVGWDASRRGEYLTDLRGTRGFPWRPIVTGTSPQLFGTFLDHALRFNDETKDAEHVIFIHAWNEWSEGSAVEPGTETGHAYLAEISRRFTHGRRVVQLTEGGPGSWNPPLSTTIANSSTSPPYSAMSSVWTISARSAPGRG